MSSVSARTQSFLHGVMAACLGVMATAVFVNVVLRYGFGSGIAASEELSGQAGMLKQFVSRFKL